MKVLAFLLAAATLSGLCRAFQDKSIAQYLVDNGYSTFVQYLNQTGLLNGILSTAGHTTVLAPTDAAFSKMDQSKLREIVASPADLIKVLKYHMIGEVLLTPMIQQNSNVSKMTLEGHELTFTNLLGMFLVDGKADIPSGIGRDVVVRNGVVQEISSVLIPPTVGALSISQTLLQDDAKFWDFYLALVILDLVPLLNVAGSDFTVFAPVNSAFYSFDDSKLNFVAENFTEVHRDLFKYNIVPGRRYASQLVDGQTLLSLHGESLTVTKTAAGMAVDGVPIIETDIIASNGIIHVIGGILTPSDILKP